MTQEASHPMTSPTQYHHTSYTFDKTQVEGHYIIDFREPLEPETTRYSPNTTTSFSMEQAAGKRKQEDDGEVDVGKRAKAEDGNGGGRTVTDAEVDEFFAILRRIHVAVKYFEKGHGGAGLELTAMEKRWKRIPSSEEVEDFGEDNGVKDDGKREHLDLNLDPSSN